MTDKLGPIQGIEADALKQISPIKKAGKEVSQMGSKTAVQHLDGEESAELSNFWPGVKGG